MHRFHAVSARAFRSSADRMAGGAVDESVADSTAASARPATAFMLVGPDWRVMYLSEDGALITESPSAPAVGENMWAVVPSWWDSDLKRGCETAMATRREIRCDPVDHAGRALDITIFPIDDGIGVVVQDVSTQAAEGVLPDSPEQIRSILDNVGDLVTIFDLRRGRHRLVSRSQIEITGLGPEELDKTSPEDLLERVHPDDRDIVLAQQEMLTSGVDGASIVDYRWKTASGEYRWFNSRRSLIRDERGQPVAIVGVSRDITDRKRREASAAFVADLARVFQSSSEDEILQEVAVRLGCYIEADSVCALEMQSGEVVRTFCSAGREPEPAVVAHLPKLAVQAGIESATIVRESFAISSAGVPGSEPSTYSFVMVPYCREGDCTQLFAAICAGARKWRQDEIDLVQQVAQRLFPRLERARAEEALRASEEMYRKIVTTASEGLWLTDTVGTITFVNKVMADWLGYEIDEILGRRPSDFTLKDGLVDTYCEWDSEGGDGSSRYDFKLRCKDGSPIWLSVSGAPLQGADGSRVGNLTMFVNISERKHAEQALAFHARLLECVHDAICAMDSRNRIIYWNEMAESMFGWTADEVMGNESSEVLGDIMPRTLLESAECVSVRDAYCSGEVACRHKDGREIHASVNATVVRGQDHEVAQVVASFHDVTERKQAADALKQSHLVLENELMRTTVLRELASAVASSLDQRTLSEQALRIAQERMGCDAGCVYVLDEASGPAHAVAHFGYADGHTELDAIDVDASTLAGRAILSGSVEACNQADAPAETVRRCALLGFGPHRFIGIPIVVRGVVLGAMGLSAPDNREFSTDDIELYKAVAQQLSVGFENSRLYETEHRIAETLQETLVMLPSRVPGVAFSRAYQSAATESGRVGGDFFDIFEIHGPHVGVVIGDVSGKGVDAAVITSLIRNTVRAHAIDGLAPREVCAKTNRVVYRFTEIESYATMFFGVLNTRSGLLRYVTAGHPPALMAHPDGGSEVIDGSNPIIGAFEQAEFVEGLAVMRPGDRLILYTDGVTEARAPSARRFFELDGLRLSVRENARAETSNLARLLMHDVLRYSDNVLRDDAAILAVQATRLKPDEQPENPQLDFG